VSANTLQAPVYTSSCVPVVFLPVSVRLMAVLLLFPYTWVSQNDFMHFQKWRSFVI